MKLLLSQSPVMSEFGHVGVGTMSQHVKLYLISLFWMAPRPSTACGVFKPSVLVPLCCTATCHSLEGISEADLLSAWEQKVHLGICFSHRLSNSSAIFNLIHSPSSGFVRFHILSIFLIYGA